jgi:hypothetical protein
MGWATHYIGKLQAGETVKFRPRGHSMSGRIESEQQVTVEPLGEATLSTGDIVLCRCHGREYLHLIKAIRPDGLMLIGNNRGGTNGWIHRNAVYGRCIAVEP